MPENIEIKAIATDFNVQQAIAEGISDKPLTILRQKDIFYNCSTGRLKLRIFNETLGELIAYHRDDKRDAKHSSYEIYPTDSPGQLGESLAKSLGVLGVVSKTRYLYFVEQTRIHMDDVERLGNFIEFEYVLSPDEDRTNGKNAIRKLMRQMNVFDDDLISHAYIDILLSNT